MDTGEHAGVAATDGTPDDQRTAGQGMGGVSDDTPTYGGPAYQAPLYGANESPPHYTPQWVPDSPPAGYPWMTAGAGPAGMPPAYPPIYDEYGGGGRGRRGRVLRNAALGALALLIVLGGGVAIGAAAFGSHPASPGQAQATTSSIGSQPAPTVVVPSDLSNLQQTVENVAKAVEPSVVEITSTGQGGEGIGSGDILTSTGYIVTNDHVVDGFSNFTVTLSNGHTLPAQLVGSDPQDDLAVIKVSATNLTPISFADSSKVTVGEFVVAYGTPLGERNTATFGTVTGLNRTESEAPSGPAGDLTGMIQESAPIAPGNSGGALVDMHAQLIGIPTLGQTTGGRRAASGSTDIGFAIASNQVKTVAQQLIQSGHVGSSSGSSATPSAGTGQGFIGIQAQDVTPQVAAADGLSVQSGVLVAGYANDTAGQSPARQAGLQVGDVITAVNGQSVASGSDLASILSSDKPGTRVTLTIVRGTTQLSVQVTLGDRPVSAQG